MTRTHRPGLAALLAITLSACTAAPQAATQPATQAAPAALLLVGNKGEDTVSFIDLGSGAELARTPTSHRAPHEIAVSPDQARAAVVNYGDNAIDIFDIASRAVVDTVDLGTNTRPHGIAWLGDGRIVATTEGGRSVVELVPEGEAFRVRSVPTDADGTHMLAANAAGTLAWTANLGDRTVSRIDLAAGRVTHTVTAGTEPEGIDLSGDETELWVSSRGSNEVHVFDASTMRELATIPVGRFPLRLLISPDGRLAATSNLQDGSVTLIDTESREVVRTVPVSGTPVSQQVTLLWSGDGSRLFVAETGTDTVAELDVARGEVVRRIAVGDQGDGLAIVER